MYKEILFNGLNSIGNGLSIFIHSIFFPIILMILGGFMSLGIAYNEEYFS